MSRVTESVVKAHGVVWVVNRIIIWSVIAAIFAIVALATVTTVALSLAI